MSPYGAYATVNSNVDADDKPKLLLKVFEMIQVKLDVVKGAINEKNFEKKYEELTKLVHAMEIIEASVDMSHGEIAANLVSLYQYIGKRLREVHRKPDTDIVDECKSLINTLHEGFSEACRQDRISPIPAPAKVSGSACDLSRQSAIRPRG